MFHVASGISGARKKAAPTAMAVRTTQRLQRKRIVLKFGSGILTRANSAGLDPKQIARLTAEVAALIRAGHECIAVTSGAVAAGMAALSLKERPLDLATAQASAAARRAQMLREYLD